MLRKVSSFFRHISPHTAYIVYKEAKIMDQIHVKKRDTAIKAKRLRQLGMVPGNIIGKSLPESISIQMEEAEARRLVRQLREGSKIAIDLEGQAIPAQIKEKSLNTLNNEILHLSFQALVADEKVNSVIHILLENEEKAGNQLEKMMMEIPYASLPADMIDTITIDLDGMAVGTVVMVKDIPELMSDAIELRVDPEEIVLRISDKTYQDSQAETDGSEKM